MKINDLPDKQNFLNSSPFNHVVIDNFLYNHDCEKLLEEFPDISWQFWHKIKSKNQIKYICQEVEKFPISIRLLIQSLCSRKFLKQIEELTGIQKLIPDPYFFGGGLHMIPSGGRLEVHSDFSELKHLKIYRRLNLLLYLNKDWKDEYNGQLEFWKPDLSKCEKKISPNFNRCVIFRTDTKSFHGHPEPLNAPKDTYRKSIALYYYTIEKNVDTFGMNVRWQTKITEGKKHSMLKWFRHYCAKNLHTFSSKIEKIARIVDKHN